MTKLDEILDKQYIQGYRDSTRRASGQSAWTHASKNKIKALMLALVGDDQHLPTDVIGSLVTSANNCVRYELRQKVDEL